VKARLGVFLATLLLAWPAYSQNLIQGRSYGTNQNLPVAVDSNGDVIISADGGFGISVTVSLGDGGITVTIPGTTYILSGDGGIPVFIIGQDAGLGSGGGAVYILGGDGGLPPSTYAVTQKETVCCGSTATAFPTALAGRTGVTIQNQGPFACVNDSSSMNIYYPGNLCLGPGTPNAAPGDAMTLSAAASDTLYCIAPVAQGAADAGGCLQVLEVK
jgi:hypothetical protein